MGRVFVVGAKRTLAAAREAVAQAREADKGERGRLIIGSLTPITFDFLPEALARFRERFPLVEVTVLHMNNRVQIDALLNGEIMLGIGFPGPNMDTEALTATVFFRSQMCVLCSEHRWPKERTPPSLADFRYDNFLAPSEFSPDYVAIVRDLCLREAGFEPKLEPIGNTLESVLSMVAAGRGVFLRPLISPSDRPPAVNCYVLNEVQTKFELSLIQNKSGATPTVNNFVEILLKSIRRLKVSG